MIDPDYVMGICRAVQAKYPNDPKVAELTGAVFGLVDVLKKNAAPGVYQTTSSDGVGKLMDCVRESAHVPLMIGGTPAGHPIGLGMPPAARVIGNLRLCARCGLQYWEGLDEHGRPL